MRDEIQAKLDDIFKARGDFFALLDTLVPKKNGTDVFDFANAKEADLKEIYAKFYAFDYSVRRLLPDVYKVFDVKAK
ncbi:CmeU family protein [Campylobacter mucosalis]|uniref:Chain-length determining protein n=1 Tax=Campylobacter mucosalis CCUG 21559 TaxID=1032067 RepID=A0A6G5QGV0_9BACT|nr:CmeU family protein [Campylobacter mucosalis]KEA46289.1 chain-length determining protein [Campylobacter mucosalis]QCD44844.1 hypothetical protein CMUC_1063 [Campylobacter mucosalis CCUG 21559]QKF62760.1 hypothetical protein CMCT_0606 [Campylobacter mucosalis]